MGKRGKYQYSIPMHRVERLPLIREESPTKLYTKDPYSDFVPYKHHSVGHLPEISASSPPISKRQRSPLDVDHTTLRWLISDYLNYVKHENEDNFRLPKIHHSPTCRCCMDRNVENLTQRGSFEPSSYEKLLMERMKQKHNTKYNTLIPNPNRAGYDIYERDFLKNADMYEGGRYKYLRAQDPSDEWIPRRRAPYGYSYLPREYLIPSQLRSVFGYEDLDDYIMRLNQLEIGTSGNVLDADETYRSSMKKLRQHVYRLDR